MTKIRLAQDDVLIVGAGLAGLLTALHLAPHPVTILTAGALGTLSSSAWAQGGVAAAVGPDDSTELHLADTLAAGAGLCDPEAARRIVEAGPGVIETLARYGARFDRDEAGALRVGMEAAHSRRRIVHATGDGAGREIVRALVAAVAATPSITVLEGLSARRLLLDEGRVCGVLAQRRGEDVVLRASRVVLATGGVGALFRHTTNPSGAYGAGIAMAALAGAALRGMEFVQFHPTALDVGRDPMPLVSEAVRGEGATLIDDRGAPVMAGFARADLEPRDVVSREVWRVLAAGGGVRLDATGIADFAHHFPAIHAFCRTAGIDPATQPIPVRPAAHYHMGGVAVDAHGRTSVPGLWACGEVASTGLHGANRLASNSLLEAAACARFVARDLAATPARAAPAPDLPLAPADLALPAVARIASGPRRPAPAAALAPDTLGHDTARADVLAAADTAAIRPLVSRGLGVLRDGHGLREAVLALLPRVEAEDAGSDPARVALLIAVAALRRPECVGSHWRTDAARSGAVGTRAGTSAPQADPPALPLLTLDEALAAARLLRDEAALPQPAFARRA
ncbi:MAG: L-aspartate oxidase [Janthinobacterium lividum]